MPDVVFVALAVCTLKHLTEACLVDKAAMQEDSGIDLYAVQTLLCMDASKFSCYDIDINYKNYIYEEIKNCTDLGSMAVHDRELHFITASFLEFECRTGYKFKRTKRARTQSDQQCPAQCSTHSACVHTLHSPGACIELDSISSASFTKKSTGQ